jgi:CheY-like chemotaxis protein
MPDEDGYSLLRTVRALHESHGSRIPAIALTALARKEDRREALLAGYQMHLSKPIEPAELIAAVASLAARSV